MFTRISEALPERSMRVRAQCSVTGDTWLCFYDAANRVFKNEYGEVIVFGDAEARPDDAWEAVDLAEPARAAARVYLDYECYYNLCDVFRTVVKVFDDEVKALVWKEAVEATDREWREYEEHALE